MEGPLAIICTFGVPILFLRYAYKLIALKMGSRTAALPDKERQELSQRIAVLESSYAELQKQVFEIHDSSEFALKLLGDQNKERALTVAQSDTSRQLIAANNRQ